MVDRWNRGAWLFRDDTLRKLEFVLDELFRIPGTGLRFDLDGIVGLVPGLGNVLPSLFSLVISVAAWIRGAPASRLYAWPQTSASACRASAIPLFGEHLRHSLEGRPSNYLLLQLHLGEPGRRTWRDWMFLLLIGAALTLIFATPVTLVLWFLAWLLRR